MVDGAVAGRGAPRDVARAAWWAPATAWRACAWYVALTLVMTWPLVTRISSGIPGDLGDPLLNCWILGWNADHFLRAVTGDPVVLAGLWHGNIFHPDRYTLGYSELLVAQAIQILPVYAATGNLVLGYNLLFLSIYVVAGVGMFLLVRALVGDWRAAFVAGLLFAFMPYRSFQAAHLQVMSSQWMPLALFGFHRAIASRRLLPLAGGTVALLAQNLSCGYYLVFFSLFVPPFVVFELHRHGRLGDGRLWFRFAIAALAVAAATLPFMQPYLALREATGGGRLLRELTVFAADTWGWLTMEQRFLVWGPALQTVMEHPEAVLFPGAIPVLLAGVALATATQRAWLASAVAETEQPRARGRRVAVWIGAAVALAGLAAALLIVAGGGGVFRPAGLRIRITSLTRALSFAAAGTSLVLFVSARGRAIARAALGSPLAFAAACGLLAWYLSLGPVPRAHHNVMDGPPLYRWLFEHVPGFDGLRVPARFGMIATFFLMLVGAWGLRDLLRRWPGRAGALTVVMSALWLAEAAILPFPLGGVINAETPGVHDPPASVRVGADTPPVYRFVRDLPPPVVLLEFPFGEFGWEVQYVYYSTMHWQRLVNGYSGTFPGHWWDLRDLLRQPQRQPERAWAALLATGATHVIVHGEAYDGDMPPSPRPWLNGRGAELVWTGDGDEVYRIPR